jgi:hypothetical protein
MGDRPWGYTVYARTRMDIKKPLREPSRLRPLRRAVDIVPKPRVWNRGARAIFLEA